MAAMSTSATLNVGSYLQIQNKIRITLLRKVETPAKIFLKIGAEAIKVVKFPEEADVILHITAYKSHLEALNPETASVARYILAQRGYDSIPLVTHVEAKVELQKDIAEGITGAVEIGNQLALEHIHQELLSETSPYEYNEGQSPAYQRWFSDRITWARKNDRPGAIFKVQNDRSFSIAGLDGNSLNQLNKAFARAAKFFESEDSAKQVAPTAFRDVHEAVQEADVGMIKKILEKVNPGQNVIYLQILDPNSGVIAQVHSRELANMALFLQPHNFDLKQASFRMKIRMQKSQARTSIAYVSAVYLRSEVLNLQSFFAETIGQVNREIDIEFRSAIAKNISPEPTRETLAKDREPIEEQLANIRMPGCQIIPWQGV
jgi:hypothetical protein